MNKITPSRIAIFSSEVMMKKRSIVVVSSTDEALPVIRLVESSTNRDELGPDLTGADFQNLRAEIADFAETQTGELRDRLTHPAENVFNRMK